MPRPLLTSRQLALPLAIGLAMPLAAMAQTTAPSPTAGTNSATAPASTGKLIDQYAAWAGSTANARSLVNGLATGGTVTLNASTAAGGTTTAGSSSGSTSFSPSGGKMGVGEVGIALSLAQASLAQQGITNPTPAQISAALNGGMVTGPTSTMSVPGVLSQRASGMGWGQIAQAMGVKLGSVVSASKTDKAQSAQTGRKDDKKSEHAREQEQRGKHAESEHRSETGESRSGSSGRESHGGGHGGGNGGGGGGGGGKK